MKIGAYVLVADPTWIGRSISKYYNLVDTLVVSYDETSTGWSGAPIPVDLCMSRLRALDVDSKILELPGNYATFRGTPMERETRQRQDCIDYLSQSVDWILQIDTDEMIPDIGRLMSCLRNLPVGVDGIEWPMRVLYRQLASDKYLAVSDKGLNPVYEYPGPILVRKNVVLRHARCISSQVIRFSVIGDTSSLQLQPAHVIGVKLKPELSHHDAIVHNSWARSPKVIWTKINSWGHNAGWKSIVYFVLVWLPSPIAWKVLRDFHPFSRGLWPRLQMICLSEGDSQ